MIDNHSRTAILITIFIFYLIPAVIVLSVINWHDENFGFLLLAFTVIPAGILFIEGLSQVLNRDDNSEIFEIFIVLSKGVLICIAMTFFYFFIVSYLFVVILDIKFLSKGNFNFLVTSSFVLTLFSYFFYQKYRVPKFMEIVTIKLADIISTKKTVNDSPNLATENDNEKVVKEKVSKIIDLFTILATIFLLSNSTFTALNSSAIDLKSNPFDSLEFSALIYVIPIYVQSAYYRLTL